MTDERDLASWDGQQSFPQSGGNPMIKNPDKGIAVAKPLAWSILAIFVCVIWWATS